MSNLIKLSNSHLPFEYGTTKTKFSNISNEQFDWLLRSCDSQSRGCAFLSRVPYELTYAFPSKSEVCEIKQRQPDLGFLFIYL